MKLLTGIIASLILFTPALAHHEHSEPNAQVILKADDVQEMVTFEMFKPKIKKGKMVFTIKSISDAEKDLLTGLKGKELDNLSLFIDESSATIPCTMNGTYLKSANLSDANLAGANLYGANLNGTKLTEANLTDVNLKGARYNSDTYWGSSDTILSEGTIWNDTTCPNGTNSYSNPSCGF